MASPDTQPILFAHRGGKAHAPENTLEAFTGALAMGATGLETDVWLTADGEPMCDHDGVRWRRGLRKSFANLTRDALGGDVMSLGDLYAACGTDYELSIDIKTTEPNAAAATLAAVVDRARAAGAESRLWLCSPDAEVLRRARAHTTARLVHSTRIKRMKEGPERHAANLAHARIDAVNLHERDWSGGLTALFGRFELRCLGWDAQFERVVAALASMGLDAIYGDHVDRLVAGVAPGSSIN